MIDPNFRVEKKETKSFPPIPKDVYQVEVLDINTDKRPTYDTRLKQEHEKVYETVFVFQFTLLEGNDGQPLRGRNVWANFVPAYLYIGKKGKNDLYRIIEATLGRELTPQEEANGIDGNILNSLIGKQLRVLIEPKKSKDGSATFDSIVDYMKANNRLTGLTAEEKEAARVKKDKDAAAPSVSESAYAGYPEQGGHVEDNYAPFPQDDPQSIIPPFNQ